MQFKKGVIKIATKQTYNDLNHEPKIGQMSFGWKCIKYYTHHNLWQRVSNNSANGRKECFPKKTVPNQYALYFIE